MRVTRNHAIATATVVAALTVLGGTGAAIASPLTSPMPVSQAFGLPESGTCDATSAPEWANVPGAPVGGWQKGWGSWLNAGKGGPACVRVLNYNASARTWVVGR